MVKLLLFFLPLVVLSCTPFTAAALMTAAATSPQNPALHDNAKCQAGKGEEKKEQRRQERGHGAPFTSRALNLSVMTAFVPSP